MSKGSKKREYVIAAIFILLCVIIIAVYYAGSTFTRVFPAFEMVKIEGVNVNETLVITLNYRNTGADQLIEIFV